MLLRASSCSPCSAFPLREGRARYRPDLSANAIVSEAGPPRLRPDGLFFFASAISTCFPTPLRRERTGEAVLFNAIYAPAAMAINRRNCYGSSQSLRRSSLRQAAI